MYPKQSMQDFYQQVNEGEVTILDVREPNEYALIHIPGAISFPLSRLSSNIETLSKNQTYHIICQSGSRSVIASDLLAKQGFNVVCVQGGISNWPGKFVGY